MDAFDMIVACRMNQHTGGPFEILRTETDVDLWPGAYMNIGDTGNIPYTRRPKLMSIKEEHIEFARG
jgi:hypothetical protein